jgi:hypothetical protein
MGLALGLPSRVAWACAVCAGEEKDSVRLAYNYSTGWLSFVPLIFMAGVFYYIYRRVKRGSEEE